MIGFILNSILLGIGLAMDAFSVSIANGLNEPDMRQGRKCLIAGVYAFFQFLMPVIGWFCVHTMVSQFRAFEPFIPWIALLLLLYIGGKMLLEGIRDAKEGDGAHFAEMAGNEAEAGSAVTAGNATPDGNEISAGNAALDKGSMQVEDRVAVDVASAKKPVHMAARLTAGVLLLQGVATSIDALSVGFAIAEYTAMAALVCALIIAVVTFIICMGGLAAGQKLGEKLAGKAGILGGCILIFIGIEIFVRGVLL